MSIKNKKEGPQPIPKLEAWQEVALNHRLRDDEKIAEYLKVFPGTRPAQARLQINKFIRSQKGVRW